MLAEMDGLMHGLVMRWVRWWRDMVVCERWQPSVRCVVGSIGPERVWAECMHRLGCADAENPVVKA